MAALTFTSGATVLTFTNNPSAPQGALERARRVIRWRKGDGSERIEDKGPVDSQVDFRWTDNVPMTADDYRNGMTNLLQFYRDVNGSQDTWTLTDVGAVAHTARFASAPQFSEVAYGATFGFAGVVAVLLVG